MPEVSVEILRHPTDEDWRRCKMLALNTIGRRYAGSEVTEDWKRKILRSEHSPIRTLMFTIRLELPYWVSVHFCRHKYGVEHYVSSQRNDRQDKYDRTRAPQGAFVVHVMDINAAELMQMARMRLCRQASVETRMVMTLIRDAVVEVNPEFADFLQPKCVIHGGCNEFVPCGYWKEHADD
jgi:thymidylate synthase ThyX